MVAIIDISGEKRRENLIEGEGRSFTAVLDSSRPKAGFV